MPEKNVPTTKLENLGNKGELSFSQKEETQKDLAENLTKEKVTSEEYFKDFETKGQYPETIQEAWKEGYPEAILWALKNEGVNRTSSEEELLGFLPKEKYTELWNLAHKHFGTLDFLVDYSGEGSQECSDGSDLLTIVKWNGKYYLAKLACGEFNRKTFTEGSKRLPEVMLHKSEIPLFVVNQTDSYFATAGTTQADIRNIDVRLYLDLFAKLASLEKGKAEKRSSYMEEKIPFNWSQIKIPEYEELKSILEKKIQGE